MYKSVNVMEEQTLKKARKLQKANFDSMQNGIFIADGITGTIVSWAYIDYMTLDYSIYKRRRLMKQAIIKSELPIDLLNYDAQNHKAIFKELEEMGFELSRTHFSAIFSDIDERKYKIDWALDYDKFERFEFKNSIMIAIQKDYLNIKSQYFKRD